MQNVLLKGNLSNNAMKAPQRGYNVPTNDAKKYFINSQAQLQGEVAR